MRPQAATSSATYQVLSAKYAYTGIEDVTYLPPGRLQRPRGPHDGGKVIAADQGDGCSAPGALHPVYQDGEALPASDSSNHHVSQDQSNIVSTSQCERMLGT